MLAGRGCRVIVPHLRGHGTTRFVDPAAPRAGQQAAIGVDTVEMLDALRIRRAVVAGYDWGGRAACVAAALWPERCTGLVSVNGYPIQDVAKAKTPLPPRPAPPRRSPAPAGGPGGLRRRRLGARGQGSRRMTRSSRHSLIESSTSPANGTET
jgi:pimeloyl-ACP methyl ester carboxylesterase